MDKPMLSGSEDGPSEDVLRRMRVPLMRRASLTGDGRPQDVFVIDLGLTGVFLEGALSLTVGSECELQFTLPGNDLPIVTRCLVAWHHAGDPEALPRSLPTGRGLDFVGLAAADAERIRGYLEEYYRREPRARRFVVHASDRRNEGGS
jgi:PilZ domain-containing protein